MDRYPYSKVFGFFADINTPLNLGIALLLFFVITIFLFQKLKSKISATLISIVLYLVVGAFFAPGMWGGEAQFLYDPAHLLENLFSNGAWQIIVLWPLTILLGV